MTTPDSEELQRLINGIVTAVQPLRILLFGSAVRGTMHDRSDLDVLVVVPDGSHRRHTAQKIYTTVRGVGVPFDVVVATPSDLERYADHVGLIYRTILEEGREVYAA